MCLTMKLNDFNQFCNSLPNTTYSVQWRGSHVWKIGGKIFAIGNWGSKKNKQYILLFTIVISIILVLYFISKIYPSVTPDGKIGVKKNTEYHLIGSILLLIMMFVMTMNFYEISENAQTQQ